MMEMRSRRRAVQIAVSSVCIGCLLIALSTIYPFMLLGVAGCGFGIGASIPGIFVNKKLWNRRNMVKM